VPHCESTAKRTEPWLMGQPQYHEHVNATIGMALSEILLDTTTRPPDQNIPSNNRLPNMLMLWHQNALRPLLRSTKWPNTLDIPRGRFKDVGTYGYRQLTLTAHHQHHQASPLRPRNLLCNESDITSGDELGVTITISHPYYYP